MTESTTPAPVTPPPATQGNSVFGTKIPSTVAFAAGLLMFLLPFMDIRCNSLKLMSVSGVELATGYKIKTGNNDSVLGSFDNMNMGNNKPAVSNDSSQDPNVFALAALGLGIAGLLLSLLNARAGGSGGLVTGALATISLIALAIDLKADLKKAMKLPQNEFNTGDAVISISMSAGFYLALLAFAAAAFFCYKRLKSPA